MVIYFKNLTVKLQVLNILNTHIKFHVNWILFTIWSINLFLCIYKNLKFKYLIDNIVFDFWSSKNFANIENMKRKYNSNVDLSKFASNKKILSGVVDLNYYQVCCKIFSYMYSPFHNMYCKNKNKKFINLTHKIMENFWNS